VVGENYQESFENLLLRNGQKIGTQVGAFVPQVELDPQIFAMKIDRCFGNV
jgi:hypothetical protein